MNLIVAVDKDYGIAKEGDLLAKLPKDLQYFKEKTLGNVVIMGRKTLESLPGKRPLPGRINIILTRDQNYDVQGAVTLHSLEEVLNWLAVQKIRPEQIFVSGGAEIYQQFLPYCQQAYVTKIRHSFGADRFIDKIEERPDWQEINRSKIEEENGYQYEWITYRRKI